MRGTLKIAPHIQEENILRLTNNFRTRTWLAFELESFSFLFFGLNGFFSLFFSRSSAHASSDFPKETKGKHSS